MTNRIVSGIRPTGNLHLGNYFGAVKNFLKLQEESDCFFFIADYHSLTTHPTPENLNNNVKQVLAEFVACGLDPEKATLYIQSDVPETAELYLFFNMNAYLGELMRVTSFKEKARKHPNNVNAGLLTYPTLMAADILIHRAAKVPVGKDQEQHLEMTRTFASRFNRLYSTEFFPEPVAYNFGEELVKVPGLDGSGKMGKSEGEGNAIFLIDDEKSISKKIMRAVTDSGPTEPGQTPPQSISNLFALLDIVSTSETATFFRDAYANCNIRYGDLKKQLAVDMNTFVAPIRERILDVVSNEALISKIAATGREKARASASRTIEDVRRIIGFKTL
ncbi:MAG: tryptophan--tRNA ligase [Bacteroidetes bacterium HGW-Bacteroidetes-6]|jgi:tryptophanyl-tRNA synthetase|nr:MAG: tryptophan--tRNA ligase [Bacteroidetes bacterium HGW-Bacteroidetes-6]